MFVFMARLFAVIVAGAMSWVDVARADIATADALDKYIRKRHNIALDGFGGGVVAMSYIMKAVDRANYELNGFKLIDYATGKEVSYADDPNYATSDIASIAPEQEAVDTLIKKIEFPLWVVPETTAGTFVVNIASAGTFYINWGDGIINKWTKGAGQADISHNYADGNASNHKVYIGGDVTAHATTANGAIYFGVRDDRRVREVGGCMGCVFHTIGAGTEVWQQPQFRETFEDNKQLTSVPPGLFAGLRGSGHRMFFSTFNKSGLTAIPDKLFGDSKLEPASSMFENFCKDCKSLETIPENLFANVSGDATGKTVIFHYAFSGCTALKAIPVDLFGTIENINDPSVFSYMFYNDAAVKGPLAPKLNGKYVWEWWPDWTTKMLYFVPLDNWDLIPAGWR